MKKVELPIGKKAVEQEIYYRLERRQQLQVLQESQQALCCRAYRRLLLILTVQDLQCLLVGLAIQGYLEVLTLPVCLEVLIHRLVLFDLARRGYHLSLAHRVCPAILLGQDLRESQQLLALRYYHPYLVYLVFRVHLK